MVIVRIVVAMMPVGLVLWMALAHRFPMVVGDVSSLSGPARRHPAECDARCRLNDVVVTGLFVLEDDLLIGYKGGHGSWFVLEPGSSPSVTMIEGVTGLEGQLVFPAFAHHARALRILEHWCRVGARLTAFAMRDLAIIGLTDSRRRQVVVAELPALPRL